MTEQIRETDIKSRPFEERVWRFQTVVQAIGIMVSGEEEYTLRELGRQIVKFHSLPMGDEREQLKE